MLTRIAVHKDNLQRGLPAVWLIEQDGVLYAATGFTTAAEAWGASGRLQHGPTVWIETAGPVELENPQRLT